MTSRASASCWAWAGESRWLADAEFGVQPVGQLRHPGPRVDGRQRRADLVVGGLGPRQRHVLPQRAEEDVVLLGDQRDLLAQLLQRQLHQRHAADA